MPLNSAIVAVPVLGHSGAAGLFEVNFEQTTNENDRTWGRTYPERWVVIPIQPPPLPPPPFKRVISLLLHWQFVPFVAFGSTDMAWHKRLWHFRQMCHYVVRVSFSGRRAVGEREPKSRTGRPCAVSGEFVAFGSTEMAFSNKTGRFPEFFLVPLKK